MGRSAVGRHRRVDAPNVVPSDVQPRHGPARSWPAEARLFEVTDAEIVSRLTADLVTLHPELEGKLGETFVRRHPRVVPFWAPGGRASLPTLRDHLGPVHLAGDYQPDMPSLADAAASGEHAAQQVLASLLRHGQLPGTSIADASRS
jgi:hypothetical protein